MEAPFKVGQRVHPEELLHWDYTGLSGKPGRDKNAVRSFRKGDWVMELYAHSNPGASTRVVSIRTLAEDTRHWTETRARLMRHKRQAS